MKVLVNGEVKELECIINGVDCSQDLHGNTTNDSVWNEDAECYEMTQEGYDWWEEYFKNYENDEEIKNEIIEEVGSDKWYEVYDKEFVANDMEDEHNGMLAVFEKFGR